MTQKIVLSYKHEDAAEYADILHSHFNALNSDETVLIKFDFFYSRTIPTASDWDYLIQDKFQNAHIAICLISKNYFNKGYVSDKEIPILLRKKKKNPNFQIEQIYIDDVLKKNAFSKYQSYNPETSLSLLPKFEAGRILRDFVKQLSEKNAAKNINYTNSKYPLKPLSRIQNIIFSFTSKGLKNRNPREAISNLSDDLLVTYLPDLHPNLNSGSKYIHIVGLAGVGKTFYLNNLITNIANSYPKLNTYLISLSERLINNNKEIDPGIIWDNIVEQFENLYSLNIELVKYVIKKGLVFIIIENINSVRNNKASDIFFSFNKLIKEFLKISNPEHLYLLTTSRMSEEQTSNFTQIELLPLEPLNKGSNFNKRNVLEYYYDIQEVDRIQIQKDYQNLDYRKMESIEKLFRFSSTRTPLFINLSYKLAIQNNNFSNKNEANLYNPLDIFNNNLPNLIDRYFLELISRQATQQFPASRVYDTFYGILMRFAKHNKIGYNDYNLDAHLVNDLSLLNQLGLLSFNKLNNEYNFLHDLIKGYFFTKYCFDNSKYHLLEEDGMTKDCSIFIIHFITKDALHQTKDATNKLEKYISYSLPKNAESFEAFLSLFSNSKYEDFLESFGNNRTQAEAIIIQTLNIVLDITNPKTLSNKTVQVINDFVKQNNFRESFINQLSHKLFLQTNINLIRIAYPLNDPHLNTLITNSLNRNFQLYFKNYIYLRDFLKNWVFSLLTEDLYQCAKVIVFLYQNKEENYYFKFELLEEIKSKIQITHKEVLSNILKATFGNEIQDSINCYLEDYNVRNPQKVKTIFSIINYLIESNDSKLEFIEYIHEFIGSKFIFIPSGELKYNSKSITITSPFLLSVDPKPTALKSQKMKINELVVNMFPETLKKEFIDETELSSLLEIDSLSIYKKITNNTKSTNPSIEQHYLLVKVNNSEQPTFRNLRINAKKHPNFPAYSQYMLAEINTTIEFGPKIPLLLLPYKVLPI